MRIVPRNINVAVRYEFLYTAVKVGSDGILATFRALVLRKLKGWYAMVWTHIFATPARTNDSFQWLMVRAIEPKREMWLPRKRDNQDMPSYLFDVAHKALLSFTTSLTKVSSQAHSFFSGLNQYLAYERLMRSCFGWAMPSSPFGAMLPSPQFWPAITSFWFPAMPQPRLSPRMLGWGVGAAPSMLRLQHTVDRGYGMAQPDLPVYGAAMAMTEAFFSLAPAILQAWSKPA